MSKEEVRPQYRKTKATVRELIKTLQTLEGNGFADHAIELYDAQYYAWRQITGYVYGNDDKTIQLFTDGD